MVYFVLKGPHISYRSQNHIKIILFIRPLAGWIHAAVVTQKKCPRSWKYKKNISVRQVLLETKRLIYCSLEQRSKSWPMKNELKLKPLWEICRLHYLMVGFLPDQPSFGIIIRSISIGFIFRIPLCYAAPAVILFSSRERTIFKSWCFGSTILVKHTVPQLKTYILYSSVQQFIIAITVCDTSYSWSWSLLN